MLAILDGDIIAFRCAVSCEDEDIGILEYRIHKMIDKIVEEVAADTYLLYISGGENFRKKIDPEYKANRKNKIQPKWRQDAVEYISAMSGCVTTDGIEADDAMGIEQCTNPEKSVICSIDKDMLMIPGEHYNWVKEKHSLVSESEGLRFFYRQLLIGDSADNVKGINGIGPVKASRFIDDSMYYEQEMFDIVRDLYNDDIRFFKNCNLLWIHQEQGKLWTHRSSHLLKRDSCITLAKEVLLPLNITEITDVSMELGTMG